MIQHLGEKAAGEDMVAALRLREIDAMARLAAKLVGRALHGEKQPASGVKKLGGAANDQLQRRVEIETRRDVATESMEVSKPLRRALHLVPQVRPVPVRQ